MPQYSSESQHVLVTGVSGAIGRPVCQELIARGHTVRGFDLVAPPESIPGLSDLRIGNLADPQAVDDAVSQVDAIVHLAAYPDEGDFKSQLLEPNVIGVYHVMESARRHHVGRVVLVSSVQVIQGTNWTQRKIPIDEPPAPRTHYAVTKLMTEAWALYYVRQHDMSVIVVRPGAFMRGRAELELYAGQIENQRIYFSPGDAGRFFALCVEVQNVPYALVYAASRSFDGKELLDLESARQVLGYEPQDAWPPRVQDLDA